MSKCRAGAAAWLLGSPLAQLPSLAPGVGGGSRLSQLRDFAPAHSLPVMPRGPLSPSHPVFGVSVPVLETLLTPRVCRCPAPLQRGLAWPGAGAPAAVLDGPLLAGGCRCSHRPSTSPFSVSNPSRFMLSSQQDSSGRTSEQEREKWL